MQRPSIAILASGGGTTTEAFIRASASGRIDVRAGVVICNNPKAGIIERIAALNRELGLEIKTLVINAKSHPAKPGETVRTGEQTQTEELAILHALQDGKYDLIALMGYMKKVGPELVRTFGWQSKYTDPCQAKMVNTHPGLLPETRGLYGIYVQRHVLERGLPYSGQTLHVVAEDYDDGPIIAEHKVAVHAGDTPETLFERVRTAEKKYLPADIAAFVAARKKYLEDTV